MTSIPQKPGLQPQGQSNTSQAASQGHSHASSITGKTSSLAPVPTATTPRSYAHATKRSFSQSAVSETPTPAVTGSGTVQGAQHGKEPSISPVNGKHPMQQTPVPVVGGLTIVNGNPTPSTPLHGDHNRKPSVTISATGPSSYMPNGGLPGRGNNLRFGSIDPQSSPAMGNPAALANPAQSTLGVTPSGNPRVTSPQTSPSPIPQPIASGGRPPSTLQGQGNNLNFLFSESGDMNRSMRPVPQGPLGPNPQASHLRRESSQSGHGDIGNHSMSGGPARGGYPPQGGRGRGYGQPHQAQMGYNSPGSNFRSNPNQPRGGPNMHQFHGHGQGRPLPPFSNSPHQATRSPALANAHPQTPPMGQVPMANPQMQPQHYSGFHQHMGTQQFPPTYDPYYYQAQPYGMPQVQYLPPSSPRPPPFSMAPATQAPYMQPQFSNPGHGPPQALPLARTPSQISAPDRPGSSLGQAPQPTAPIASQGTSRSTSSPVPKQPQFIPPKKSGALPIRNPQSGEMVTFEKPSASPARATPSPVKLGTPPTSTPPRSASRAEQDQSEKAAQTGEEKKQSFHAAVAQKIQEEADAEKRKKEAEAQMALELKQKKEKEEAEERDRQAAEAAEARRAAEEAEAAAALEKEVRTKEEVSEQGESKSSEAAVEAPAAAVDDEVDYDAIERELAAKEAAEAEAEAAYQLKKQAEREEKARKEREEAEAFEANMKNAEREAEALEEERLRKLEEDEATKRERAEVFASLKSKGAHTPTSTESPAIRTPVDSGAATPVSDASMGPPPKAPSAKREKPTPLKIETTKAVEPPQPSAAMKSLQAARFLDDPSKVSYPPSVVSPNPALNVNAPADRKFKYNKEFLLQFQAVFKEKPSLDWDNRVRETVGDSTSDTARPPSARAPMMGGRNTSRPGIPPSFPGSMGNFGQAPNRTQTLPTGAAPQDRFPNRPPPIGTNPFGPFARPGGSLTMGGTGMSRNNSSNTLQSQNPSSPRIGSSHRGGTRSGSKRDKPGKKEEEFNKAMPLTAGIDIRPLVNSQSGWKPRSIGNNSSLAGPAPGGEGHMPPDMVQRKVKANLNKMTPEKFERISDQILDIVGQSKDESDGRTLRQVIQLTFEKATDEAHWAPMYAKFCKRMLDSMSPEIKDESIRDKQGNVVTGGSLFRKYLLNRCQEEFERGWKVNLPERPEGVTEEATMLSDEYYAAAAAKRRGLGLVKFIGELYKLGMLTERIMHECVKKLVDYEGVPEEAEVESLTSLLRTIGYSLDNSEKGHGMMDAYFGRIVKMIDTPGLPSRLKFMLMDIVDLRKAQWVSKDSDKGPKTIVEIREAAARAQQEQEMERMRQQANRGGGGRMAMGRGDVRNFSGGYGSQPPPTDYASSKVGTDDLRRLKTTRNTNQPVSFGPSSMFGSRSSSGRKNMGPGGNLVRGGDDSGASSRTGTPPGGRDKKDDKEAASSTNAFSALAALDAGDSLATSPPSNPSSPPLMKSRPAIERQRSKSPSKDQDSRDAS